MFTLLLSVLTFAAIPTGQWKGEGIFDAWGVGRFPALATVEIRQENSHLQIHDCWKFERQGSPWNLCYDHEFEIRDQELYVDNTKVGSIRETEFEIIYKREEGQIHAVLRWNADGQLSGFHNAVNKAGRFTNKSADILHLQP